MDDPPVPENKTRSVKPSPPTTGRDKATRPWPLFQLRFFSGPLKVLLSILVIILALLTLGTIFYKLPVLGLATAVLPKYLLFFMLLALLAGALAFWRWLQRHNHYWIVLAVVAVLAAMGDALVMARQAGAVEEAGANISFFQTLGFGNDNSGQADAEVAYTTYAGEPLQLNIYRPPASTTNKPAPILFFIHGGGWIIGSRFDHNTDMRWFADQGWLIFSVDYTLSTANLHLWDVTQSQIGCALAWVNQNARQYGGDPARLSLTGDSAGGNLAINLAYMAANQTLTSSCGGQLPSIKAVSVLYPAVDPAAFYENPDPVLGGTAREMAGDYTGGSPQQFPERYAPITSATHLNAAAPPTLILVGEADLLVPPEATYSFSEQARNKGIEVKLVRVPYANHVFDVGQGSIGQQAYRQLTVKWLKDHNQAP